MSRAAALAALRGEDPALACGVSWVPEGALAALLTGTATEGPADSLATVARALLLDLAFVPAEMVWATDAAARLREADTAVVWAVAGVLGRTGARLGWTEAIRLSAANPAALTIALDEALHDTLVEVRAGIAAGADAILIADELSGASGPLVSPDYALDALMPCYHRCAGEINAAGVPALFHSDGDVRALMPALARAGFAAIHLGGLSPEPFLSSLAAARSAGLVVLGGIEAAALTGGARRTGEHAAAAALAGGLIVCDDGGMTTAEELTAFASAIDTARAAYELGKEHGA